ncbi:hypothetical protein KP509_12G049300 [Ceratopteris richardii]|uniref:Uncharacterized protein n=1 Tax=Ceratopteris richardii TaxID=49495 RepID=A0A8T2TIZ7_CERRI|nr:hypothetical protein KP509_12G049300 [Ceratopteris richardii]
MFKLKLYKEGVVMSNLKASVPKVLSRKISSVPPRASNCSCPLFIVYLLIMGVSSPIHTVVYGLTMSRPSIFGFGASMIDSGSDFFAMPYRSTADFYPYGSDYFGKPVGRWSNGRTFFDLIMEGLGYNLLDPYLKSTRSDFSCGVNFAYGGTTAKNASSFGELFYSDPITLLVQVDQFRNFQSQVLSNEHGYAAKRKLKEHFSKSIYFLEPGGNDYGYYAFLGDEYDPLESVSETIAAIRQGLKSLYESGGRTFIVMNVTPLGCCPGILSDSRGNGSYDEYGCKLDWIEVVELHNSHLTELLEDLRNTLPDAEWILFDAHDILLDAYRNPQKYGVLYPFKACCGSGGEYNCRHEVACAESPKYVNGTLLQWTKCEDPSLHIIWDTSHTVESFSRHLANGVLLGTHLFPPFNITEAINRN